MGSSLYVWKLSRTALADRDGIVVVLRIYMDESGLHHGSPVVTVGGYYGRPKAWKAFTREWNAAKRPIEIFHSADCANLKGEFEGWDKDDRDRYVANLMPVLPRHAIIGLSISFQLQPFMEALRPHPDLMRLFGNPYTACFRLTIRLIVDMIEKMGSNEALAFIHENNDYEQEARGAFAFVAKHYGPMSLTFGSKAAFTPLQAADVLAYESNKRVRAPEKAWRRAFAAINPGDKHCNVLFYPPDKMHMLIASLRQAQEGAKTLEPTFSLYGKVPTFVQGRPPRKRA